MLEIISKSFKTTKGWLEGSLSLSLGKEIGDFQLEQLASYLELLQLWSKKVDLVAPASDEQQVERHLVDCYAAYLLIREKIGKIKTCLDVGSGAGLPGIVFAVLEPSSAFSLCEPREKRQVFLRETVLRLKLRNIEIQGVRLEEVSKENKYRLITSRALGFEEGFDKYANPLLANNGKICQMLGPSWKGDGRKQTLSILNYLLYRDGPERKLVFWD